MFAMVYTIVWLPFLPLHGCQTGTANVRFMQEQKQIYTYYIYTYVRTMQEQKQIYTYIIYICAIYAGTKKRDVRDQFRNTSLSIALHDGFGQPCTCGNTATPPRLISAIGRQPVTLHIKTADFSKWEAPSDTTHQNC